VRSEEQGQPGFDDYTLRLGLVDSGSRRLGSLERRFAPAWVRTLFDLAPAGAGISRIRFFNLGVAANQAGLRRQHPQSELIVEEVVAVPDGDGRFNLSIALDGVARPWRLDLPDEDDTIDLHIGPRTPEPRARQAKCKVSACQRRDGATPALDKRSTPRRLDRVARLSWLLFVATTRHMHNFASRPDVRLSPTAGR
jgi:hypothetical protein